MLRSRGGSRRGESIDTGEPVAMLGPARSFGVDMGQRAAGLLATMFVGI
jgi:hypothetical protein